MPKRFARCCVTVDHSTTRALRSFSSATLGVAPSRSLRCTRSPTALRGFSARRRRGCARCETSAWPDSTGCLSPSGCLRRRRCVRLAAHPKEISMNHVIAAVRRTAAGLVGLAAGAALCALAYGQTPPANPQTPAANPQAPTASPQAPAANAARSPEAANIKKLLEQRFEGVSIGNISKTPYFGLYEVQFDEQIVYTDAKVTYVLVGSIYDAATKKNLTEAKQREYS